YSHFGGHCLLLVRGSQSGSHGVMRRIRRCPFVSVGERQVLGKGDGADNRQRVVAAAPIPNGRRYVGECGNRQEHYCGEDHEFTGRASPSTELSCGCCDRGEITSGGC